MCVNQKLIRLTARSTDFIGKKGIFETIFNDGILIEPNSSVAVQSVAFTRNKNTLIIDASNDKIIMQTHSGNSRDVRIPHGEYDSEKFLELLNNIQDALNNSLTRSIPDSHVEFEVLINDQDYVEINMNKSRATSLVKVVPPAGGINNDIIEFSTIEDANNDRINMLVRQNNAFGGNYMTAVRQNAVTPMSQLEAYIYSSVPISIGVAKLRARINQFLGGQGGVRIGFLKKTPEIVNKLQVNNPLNRIDVDDFECLIQTNLDGTNTSVYQFLSKSTGGGLTDTTINPSKVDESGVVENNDYLSIECTGNLHFDICVNTNAGGRQVVGNYKKTMREENGDLIDLICYVGIANNDTRIGHIACNLSSHSSTNNIDNDIIFDESSLVGATPYPKFFSLTNRVPNIKFSSVSVANYLGYNKVNFNTENSILNLPHQFIASNTSTTYFSTNTYLVEMLSETLDSFDAYDGGRKNILAPIPVTDRTLGTAGIISYEPNNLIYINLKNKEKRLIRNMNLRIVTDQYEPIVIIGLAEVNLLIKNESNK